MTTPNTLFFLALLSLFWGIVSSIRICSWLEARDVKINLIFIRFLIIKYVNQYREMSREETGRVGPFFYHYIIAMNVALVCGVAGLILR